MKTYTKIEKNIKYINEITGEAADVTKREFMAARDTKAFLVFVDGLVNDTLIQDSVLESLIQNVLVTRISPHVNALIENVTSPSFSLIDDFDKIMLLVLSGDSALFIDGFDKALVIASRGFAGRGVPETATESVVFGSKEAFSESLRTNTMLIRRRIRNTSLRLEQLNMGTKTKTDIGIMYIEDMVSQEILKDVKMKLENTDANVVLDIGYIEHFLELTPYSPFPISQITERPDKAASAILEGRIVIVCDNSPFVLIVPTVLVAFFQSSEDFYGRKMILFLNRALRYLAFFISIMLPGLYLAIVLYSPNMMPMGLLFRMEEARREVPFPIFLELFLMDTAFELLKEAGIRLPHALGGAIGVVGGIIIGQAAVEAGLASPIVVIIVALVAICSFTIPAPQLFSASRICKYILLFGAAFLGFFGFWIGFILIIIHVASLKSFGLPYLQPFARKN